MNKLNKIFLSGIAMLISLGTIAGSLTNYTEPEQDTVILKFGNNSQIVIYVDSKDVGGKFAVPDDFEDRGLVPMNVALDYLHYPFG